MEEIQLLEEILKKAVESNLITPSQERYYLLKYRKGELGLAQIQEEVANPSRRVRTTKKEYPLYQQYILKDCLGRGGMGEIFEAYHRETWQRVALKKIKATHLARDAQDIIRKRFMRECSLQAKLNHPNIVKVYDYGCAGKEIYLVTQLIDGETLQQLVEREKHQRTVYYENILPPLLDQMVKICDAVDYAHGNGIIHRDINPSNIMVDDEQIWIMDFGLAKRYDIEITKLTKSTELVGTPSYMSPEQWHNEELAPTTDIYSLCATLYYLVTCYPPQPEDPMATAYNIINEIPPTPIRNFQVPVPEEITQVIAKGMAFRSTDRYPDAKTLAQSLKSALSRWGQKSSMLQKLKSYLKGKKS